LSDLQAALTRSDDRDVFGRMVFPGLRTPGKLDVMRVGEAGVEHVVVRSFITDRHGETYSCWDTIEPVEIGGLCRLFFLENQPTSPSVQNQYYVVVDSQERVVAGICYRFLAGAVVKLEGIVVESPLQNRAIENAMMEDFCARMAGRGKRTVKAPLISGESFSRFGFAPDRGWSGLVRSLSPYVAGR